MTSPQKLCPNCRQTLEHKSKTQTCPHCHTTVTSTILVAKSLSPQAAPPATGQQAPPPPPAPSAIENAIGNASQPSHSGTSSPNPGFDAQSYKVQLPSSHRKTPTKAKKTSKRKSKPRNQLDVRLLLGIGSVAGVVLIIASGVFAYRAFAPADSQTTKKSLASSSPVTNTEYDKRASQPERESTVLATSNNQNEPPKFRLPLSADRSRLSAAKLQSATKTSEANLPSVPAKNTQPEILPAVTPPTLTQSSANHNADVAPSFPSPTYSGPMALVVKIDGDGGGDYNSTARTMAARLSARQYKVATSGAQTTISFVYRGEFIDAIKHVNIGTIEICDSQTRTIFVSAK